MGGVGARGFRRWAGAPKAGIPQRARAAGAEKEIYHSLVTVITATHDTKMLNISDRIAWIRDGELERVEDRANVALCMGRMP